MDSPTLHSFTNIAFKIGTQYWWKGDKQHIYVGWSYNFSNKDKQ